jgi:cell division protein FtsB
VRRKRRSKRTRDLIQGFIFFLSTIGVISCLIIYLWVFKEIDESLLAIEIQNTTARELANEISELTSNIEQLSRPDIITARAIKKLGMVIAQPETLLIVVDKSVVENL